MKRDSRWTVAAAVVRLALASVVIAGGAASSLAGTIREGEPASDLVSRLEHLEATAADAALSREARSQAAASADGLRTHLIEMLPSDDRTPTWLTDRAAFALQRLSESDTDLAVLVGLPTGEQRLRAAQAAQSALQLLEKALIAGKTAVARLEGEVLAAPEKAASAERALGRLVDIEQSQRIPLLTALAKAIAAASATSDTEKAAAATSGVRALDAIRVRTPAIEAARDTVAALLLLNASGAASERAIATIKTKLGDAMRAPGVEPATKTRARLAMLAVGTGEPTSGAPWSLRLIEHEARVRASLGGLGGGNVRKLRTLAGASLDLMNLTAEPVLAAERGDLGEAAVRDARRALVYAKLAPVVDAAAPPGAIPAELVFARAVTMLRESDRAAPNAAPLLQHVAERLDATADLRADAHWELAASYDKQPGQGEKSVKALHDLLTKLPLSARAVDAAHTLAERLTPNFAALASGSSGSSSSGVRAEYLDAVRMLAGQPGQSRFAADLIRAELFADRARVTTEAFQSALSAYRSLPDGASKAAAKAAIVLALPKLAGSLESLGAGERKRLIAQSMAFVNEHAPEHVGAASLVFGEALQSADDPDRAEMFASVIGSPIDIPGSSEAARARLGLARALRAAHKPDQAVTYLRELAAQFEKAPGESGREPAYWSAWCELLELSVLNDQSPARLGELRAHLSRLELIDPALGGAPLSERFAKLKELARSAPPASNAPGSAGQAVGGGAQAQSPAP